MNVITELKAEVEELKLSIYYTVAVVCSTFDLQAIEGLKILLRLLSEE
jgi:hypothetical protein